MGADSYLERSLTGPDSYLHSVHGSILAPMRGGQPVAKWLRYLTETQKVSFKPQCSRSRIYTAVGNNTLACDQALFIWF